MPRSNLIQTDFLAGEISPRLEMQENLEGRKHSVGLLQNWLIHLQGTVETSPGWERIVGVPGDYGRLFPFPLSVFTGFMAVITPEKVFVTDPVGFIRERSLVFNGDFEEGSTNWDVITIPPATIVFLAGVAYLNPGVIEGRDATLQQVIGGTTIGNSHTLTIQIADGEGPLLVEVGSAEGLSDIYSATLTGEGPFVIPDIVATATDTWLRFTAEGETPPKAISDIQFYDVTASPGIIEFDSPWATRTSISFIQALMSPNELSLYITSPEVPPYKLDYNEATSTWDLSAIPLVSPPDEWGSGSWPVAITFFGGRMWLGGASDDAELFWGSKSGSYFDFTLGELADDAIEQRLDRRGAIRWMTGGQTLLIGTENAEHIVSSEGGVIIPGDIYSKVQSTNGSWPAQPLEIGNEVLYVSPDGRKIRSIEYEWTKDAWRSKDLTYASEHITKGGNSFTHLHHSANPDSLIIGSTLSGNAVIGTYEAYSQTIGFSRRVTQGSIISLAVLQFSGTGELWALVDRGAGSLSLEKEYREQNVKLDSHSHFRSETPISEVSIPHLAGKTCQVLVDGAVHPDVIPSVPDGDVTLEFSGYEVIVGLAVYSIIETLPVADELPGVGTTRSMKKRMFEVWVRILDSWRPKINGQRTPNRRVPTPMGEVESARTESVRISNTGWDLEAKIRIEQDLPLRTELAGIFGRIDQEEV